jgi:opacity protein-like surface antigen
MARKIWGGVLALTLLAGAAGTAAAQETGTPIFKAPNRAFDNHEFGLSISDPGEGAGAAVEGFYRYGTGPYDFSVRGGFEDFNGPGSALLLGGDFRTQVIHYSDSFPLDGAITLGLGGVLGSDVDDFFLLPVGISLGRTFTLENSSTIFVPYVHPVIAPIFGGAGDDDVLFSLGLGVDIKFSDRWAVRASGGLGDIEGVGISIAYLR